MRENKAESLSRKRHVVCISSLHLKKVLFFLSTSNKRCNTHNKYYATNNDKPFQTLDMHTLSALQGSNDS